MISKRHGCTLEKNNAEAAFDYTDQAILVMLTVKEYMVIRLFRVAKVSCKPRVHPGVPPSLT